MQVEFPSSISARTPHIKPLRKDSSSGMASRGGWAEGERKALWKISVFPPFCFKFSEGWDSLNWEDLKSISSSLAKCVTLGRLLNFPGLLLG